MGLLPGIYRRSFEPRRFLVNHHPHLQGNDVVLDRATRSPVPPNFRVLEGTVVVPVAQGKTFVDARDPRGDRSQPAQVVALQPADATWANTTITTSLAEGLGFAVLLDAAATTTAAVVDQLNKNPLFAAHFLADDAGGLVRVRTRDAGELSGVHVESNEPSAFGPLGTFGHGKDADYRVTDKTADLRDLDMNPLEAVVPTILVGRFLENELINLTPEARAVFVRRGSFFHS